MCKISSAPRIKDPAGTTVVNESKAINPRRIAPLLAVPDAMPLKKCAPKPLLNTPSLSS
jgi:hypothetical protein